MTVSVNVIVTVYCIQATAIITRDDSLSIVYTANGSAPTVGSTRKCKRKRGGGSGNAR